MFKSKPSPWSLCPAVTAYTLLILCCVLAARRQGLNAVAVAVAALLIAKAWALVAKR